MSNPDKNSFQYYINADGDQVMRVSDVLKILAKDQLLFWANSLGFKKITYKDEMERTANIGSLCHAVLEDFFTPKMLAVVDYEAYGISDIRDIQEAQTALRSFMKWFHTFTDKHTYHVRNTEYVVVGKQLGCTIDCVIDGWDDPNKVIFVDYKSSGFYLTQFLQLAANTMIYEEVYGKNTVEGAMIVAMNKKDNKPAKARFLPRKQMNPFILCFQCMYDVAVGTKVLNKNLLELTEKV